MYTLGRLEPTDKKWVPGVPTLKKEESALEYPRQGGAFFQKIPPFLQIDDRSSPGAELAPAAGCRPLLSVDGPRQLPRRE